MWLCDATWSVLFLSHCSSLPTVTILFTKKWQIVLFIGIGFCNDSCYNSYKHSWLFLNLLTNQKWWKCGGNTRTGSMIFEICNEQIIFVFFWKCFWVRVQVLFFQLYSVILHSNPLKWYDVYSYWIAI